MVIYFAACFVNRSQYIRYKFLAQGTRLSFFLPMIFIDQNQKVIFLAPVLVATCWQLKSMSCLEYVLFKLQFELDID